MNAWVGGALFPVFGFLVVIPAGDLLFANAPTTLSSRPEALWRRSGEIYFCSRPCPGRGTEADLSAAWTMKPSTSVEMTELGWG
jgi:hypothetical protein